MNRIKGLRVSVFLMATVVIGVALFLFLRGFSYYSTNLEHRYYHIDNEWLKSSGLVGHGLGIFGALLIVVGVFSYMARKRIRFLYRFGVLKYWLEVHIFLCVLGSVLVIFHTTFKFDGIVAISFWSLVIVIISGIIGRFIYIQIPRNIEGRELTLSELNEMKQQLIQSLQTEYSSDDLLFRSFDRSSRSHQKQNFGGWLMSFGEEMASIKKFNIELKALHLPSEKAKKIKRLFIEEIALSRRIGWLSTMHSIFRYWHIIHLPFALIMLVFMVIHVVVVIVFGCTWIF